MSKKVLRPGILVPLVLIAELVFVVPIESLYTFPWLIKSWGAVLLVVSGLAWVGRIESRKKPEPEAGIPA